MLLHIWSQLVWFVLQSQLVSLPIVESVSVASYDGVSYCCFLFWSLMLSCVGVIALFLCSLTICYVISF